MLPLLFMPYNFKFFHLLIHYQAISAGNPSEGVELCVIRHYLGGDAVARRNVWMSVFLCTILTTQTLAAPLLLSAATQTTTPTIQTSANLKNPTYEEINLKLETIAKEKNIPSILLKVLAFKESTWRQFDSLGNPLLGGPSTHPAIGIMQVATYQDGDLETIQKLKTDIDFNIRRGADLLNEKWGFTPRIGDGDRKKLENWYFALWAYNTWSEKNNPNVLAVQSAQSGQTILPYQDKVINLCANPDGFLGRYITPVSITKVPIELLPKSGVPSKTVEWITPQPIHYGDLGTPESPVTPNVPPSSPDQPKVLEFIRLAGTDRIDTAIQQALKGWPEGASAVVLARADNFPDALAGVPLAARLGAPVLLSSSNELDSRVEKALKTLNPKKVYLLGGEGALSTKVSTKLKDLGWESEQQIRLSGLNRYETAANIALEATRTLSHISSLSPTTPTNTTSSVEAVAIATGENFPDALSIASIAGTKQMPILLTEPKSLPQETLNALKSLNPKKIYLIGGDGAISPSVQQEIQSQLNLPSTNFTRLYGSTRYDTMAAVAKAFSGNNQSLSFATGEDFPDALAGAALAARLNSTVILLPQSSLELYPNLKTAIDQYPRDLEAQPYIFGGAGAISSEREQELKALLSN
jgi:putative cell wall-binding protein